MNKHFLASSFESGLHLISKSAHKEIMASLDYAMNSTLLSGIDVTSMSLPDKSKSLNSDDSFWPHPQDWFAQFRPYKVKNGILTIPVRGSLVHGVGMTMGRYFTGYEYIREAAKRGAADKDVKNFLFHVDSYGGHVAGCFDTCDMIADLEKPTIAFVADTAASAAYAIASSCDKIIGTQTCSAGNIGVLATFIDITKMLSSAGVEYTYVSAPEDGHKEDGHPGTPVNAAMLEREQKDVNEIYEIFVSCVTRKRPMTADAVRATKALSFTKTASLDMGLIDTVASSVDIEIAAQNVFDSGMDDISDNTITAPDNTGQIQEENAMTEEEKKAMQDKAREEGQIAATARIAAILGAPEAEGRGATANHLAFNTAMTPEAAVAMLNTIPVAAAAPAPAPVAAPTPAPAPTAPVATAPAQFDQVMQQTAPNLTPNQNGEKTQEEKDAESVAASLNLARQAGMVGYRPEPPKH